MKTIINTSDVLELTVAERIELVEDLWDSIAEVPETVELTIEQKKILDDRVKDYHNLPNAGSPWAIVKERIRNQ